MAELDFFKAQEADTFSTFMWTQRYFHRQCIETDKRSPRPL